MESQCQEQRRASAPHHHQHHQPRYPYPEARQRSQTEGTTLRKVHSRPEDYKNRPSTDKLVEYICFDGANHPQECDELDAEETHPDLNRLDSYSSHESKMEESDDIDSEDDLTLPPTYHHDVAQQKHETPNRSPYAEARQKAASRHSHSPEGHSDPAAQVHHHHVHRTSVPAHDSRTRSPQPRSRNSSMGSVTDNELIAQVAEHLQSHKDAFTHGNGKEMVNELLGEVVRKVSDGALDPDLMKEVVREVQHVL